MSKPTLNKRFSTVVLYLPGNNQTRDNFTPATCMTITNVIEVAFVLLHDANKLASDSASQKKW